MQLGEKKETRTRESVDVEVWNESAKHSSSSIHNGQERSNTVFSMLQVKGTSEN